MYRCFIYILLLINIFPNVLAYSLNYNNSYDSNNNNQSENDSNTSFYQQQLSKLIITRINSLHELSISNFTNINKIFKLPNNKIIIHSTKLSSATTPLFKNKWLLLKSSTPTTKPINFPITQCLNNQYGDGGSIDIQSTIITQFINTVDLSLGLNVIFYYESIIQSWELTQSITWRNLYTCNVPDGLIGQIWIRSEVINFDIIELYSLEFGTLSRLSNKIFGIRFGGDGRIKLKFLKSFQKIKMFKQHHHFHDRINHIKDKVNEVNKNLGQNQKRPIISCITNFKLLDCGRKKSYKNYNLNIIDI
ncbi:uncharacterized protein KGF55_004010 [Candida pseudojiufengensis]|uniref:uncharacterized protein n=1 Tax=Candida pseudojiufengensis TaxID=497109 RepID=UPI0022254625|nr:uncharacterized protein KGF55_004010 [Candida pseudojiufengensis]KAI5961387.1 hypothetical protein KGF55_004010 [Candida pseudojiufengensis]